MVWSRSKLTQGPRELPNISSRRRAVSTSPAWANGTQGGVSGGPNSVQFDLEENDRKKQPAFEFPAFDRFFPPWFAWKERLSNKGFSLGFDYVALYQGANESLTS